MDGKSLRMKGPVGNDLNPSMGMESQDCPGYDALAMPHPDSLKPENNLRENIVKAPPSTDLGLQGHVGC